MTGFLVLLVTDGFDSLVVSPDSFVSRVQLLLEVICFFGFICFTSSIASWGHLFLRIRLFLRIHSFLGVHLFLDFICFFGFICFLIQRVITVRYSGYLSGSCLSRLQISVLNYLVSSHLDSGSEPAHPRMVF